MAYKIGDECISCGSCAGTCPVEAISEGESHYEINEEACVEWCMRSRLPCRCYCSSLMNF